ncbi:MAG: type II toxin-antitoxin system VapC family toxin, partial [Dolichospermum sp.]
MELFSALSRRVRMGEICQNDARRITELFENHLNEGLYGLVLLENQHYRLARDWISRFDLPLRGCLKSLTWAIRNHIYTDKTCLRRFQILNFSLYSTCQCYEVHIWR